MVDRLVDVEVCLVPQHGVGGVRTVQRVLEVLHVAADVVALREGQLGALGFDLRGAFIGSEGTLGIATKVIVRLVPSPASVITLLAVFESGYWLDRVVADQPELTLEPLVAGELADSVG